MNLLLALFLIIFEAVFEGLKTSGFHITSEVVELVYLVVVTLVSFGWLNKVSYLHEEPRTESFFKVIIGYVLVRFALFDMIWNISAGQDLFYYGTTKLYDKIMTQLGAFTFILKFTALIWGVAWLTKWGNK